MPAPGGVYASAEPVGVWYDRPWTGVSWTTSYVAALVFLFVIVSYQFPLGTVSILLGLLGLFFLREGIRVPVPLMIFGAFVVQAGLGYFLSPYKSFVLVDHVIAWEAMQDVVKAWLIMLVLFSAVRTRRQLRFLIVFFLACYALYPVRGAIFTKFLYGWDLRLEWKYAFGNPNDLAALLLLPLGLCAGLLFTERHKHLRWAALAGIWTIPFIIFFTESRAGIIALTLFGLFAFFGHSKHFRATLGVAAILMSAVLFAPSNMWARLRGLEYAGSTTTLSQVDEEGSAEQRYEIWRISWAVTKDRPLTGVGVGAYPAAHQEYARRGEFKPTARGARDNHSTYLNLLAETGFPGLFIYLVFLVSCLVPADRARRTLKRMGSPAAQQLYFLEVSFIAFLVAGIFGSYGRLTPTFIHLFLIWSVADMELRAAAAAPATGLIRPSPAASRISRARTATA